jgi:glycosyltransferase involved in cell wall biosynthesis
MKILHVIPYFVPAFDFGGPLTVTYNSAKMLVKRGHEVTVYTTDTFGSRGRIAKKEEIIDGIRVKRFRNLSNSLAYRHNIYFSPDMVFKIKEDLDKFDIIHLHEYRTMQNIVVHHYANKYGIPYILQAHGSLPRIMAKQRLKIVYDKFFGQGLLTDASRLIALTQTEAEQYKSMGVREEKIEIIPNGIDLSEYDNLPSSGIFRKKWNISNDQKIILFLARIHKIKGPDLLAKAFALISKNDNKLKLVFTGPDGGYLSFLKKLIKELGVEEKVLFTGPLYGRDKLEAYVDADVYVLPSVYEAFSNSVVEACGCGTPIIVTDRCGIANIIDGQVGLVVPYDEDALGKAILNILSDINKKREYDVNGKLLVREKLNWGKIAEQIETMYINYLSSKSPS